MYPFIKIATDMYPVDRIETVNLDANINGNPGIEVKLIGVIEGFTYWGAYADIAYKALVPTVVLRLGKDTIYVKDIEWVNLAAVFDNGQNGVEIRVATDQPNITRQYTGDAAREAYDQITELALPDAEESQEAGQ